MQTLQAEKFYNALNDKGIELKHLSAEDYIKVLNVSKILSSFIVSVSENVSRLIQDYNKPFLELRKTPEYLTAAVKQKESRSSELTDKEIELLEVAPVINLDSRGIATGPIDAIEKIQKIREVEVKFKKDELNFVKDAKVFKQVVENASFESQTILFEYLLKK
jgi:hypothetical protein